MSSNETYGGPSGANNSTIEYAENALISGVSGKKVFNVDSTGNIIDGYQATKVTVDGDYTYIAVAATGTDQSAARWQVKKIDESVVGTTVITWADGNANFDNVATDLTALTYS